MVVRSELFNSLVIIRSVFLYPQMYFEDPIMGLDLVRIGLI